MKIVFLDIDGVLNSHEYIRSDRCGDGERGSVIGIDPRAIARLNRLLSATGAQVVVTSTKRKGKSRVELQEMLDARGLRGVVRDATPDLSKQRPSGLYVAVQRGEEICRWLAETGPVWGVDGFVVLDDDSDMAGVEHRFIKTSFETGLTDADVDRAIVLLSSPPEAA